MYSSEITIRETKKTQETQYVETDEHHVQKETISNCGIVLVGKDGYVLILQSQNNQYYRSIKLKGDI